MKEEEGKRRREKRGGVNFLSLQKGVVEGKKKERRN